MGDEGRTEQVGGTFEERSSVISSSSVVPGSSPSSLPTACHIASSCSLAYRSDLEGGSVRKK